ncbi:MAG: ankyrin repeat domain-containing protein, partial [Methanobacteriota archaeon]
MRCLVAAATGHVLGTQKPELANTSLPQLRQAGAAVACSVQTQGARFRTTLQPGVQLFMPARRRVMSSLHTCSPPPRVMSSHTHTDLFAAVCMGDVEACVDALAQPGVSVNTPNAHGLYPLHIAAASCSPALVATLASCGAAMGTPDAAGWLPLVYSASTGHAGVTAALLEAGSPVDAPLRGVGSSAAHGPDAGVLASATQAAGGVDVASADVPWSPLTRAAFKGHTHIVEQLLVAGAAPLRRVFSATLKAS